MPQGYEFVIIINGLTPRKTTSAKRWSDLPKKSTLCFCTVLQCVAIEGLQNVLGGSDTTVVVLLLVSKKKRLVGILDRPNPCRFTNNSSTTRLVLLLFVVPFVTVRLKGCGRVENLTIVSFPTIGCVRGRCQSMTMPNPRDVQWWNKNNCSGICP
jgi:hypothetical protein